ncbi:MAG: hypothetical protein ABEJ48_03180 [Halobacteriales archaeon]
MATQDDAVVVDTPETSREITVDVAGTAPIATVTVTKNNTAWRRIDGTDDPNADLDSYTLSGEWTDDAPVTGMAWDERRQTDGDVYTVRVRQASRDRYPGMAWVGPIWVEASNTMA